MTLTKAHIVESFFARDIFTKTEYAHIVETLFERIKESLENGEDVMISGLGNFQFRSKAGRRVRNSQSGASMYLAPRKVVTFRSSGILREKVSRGNSSKRESGSTK